MKVSTPAAAIRSTAATQSTPAVRCSTSSSRAPSAVVIGRASALARRGIAGIAERDVGEDPAHAVGGLGHERRVGRDRDRQDDRLAGPELLRDLGGRLDRGSLARHDDLARRVAVGDAEHAVGRGALDERRQGGVVEAEDRGHRPVAAGAGRLHQPAALADEADAVVERDHLGGDQGGVLAHRVAGGERRRRRLDAEGRPALADGGEVGDRRREEGRLGVLGPVELIGRAVEGERADRFAEGGVGGGEDGGRSRRRRSERAVPCRPTASPGRGRRRQTRSSCQRSGRIRRHAGRPVRDCTDCAALGSYSEPMIRVESTDDRRIRGRRPPRPDRRRPARAIARRFEADLSATVLAAGTRIPNVRQISERVAMGRALWRELVIGFASQLGEMRLGFTQLAALYVLADSGTMTIGDLAEVDQPLAVGDEPARGRARPAAARRAPRRGGGSPPADAPADPARARRSCASSTGPGRTSSCPRSGRCRPPSGR